MITHIDREHNNITHLLAAGLMSAEEVVLLENKGTLHSEGKVWMHFSGDLVFVQPHKHGKHDRLLWFWVNLLKYLESRALSER